ncbi:MAG: hydroxyacylglutathione hydrolase [Betaproteobacteria bacterium]|nr:MAG: hydroxyacylglutathione hydrolase [Betaproteobacteria bacterium]
MNIEVLPLPAFDDNYIWLIRKGRDAVVVDPGDAAPVQACLQAQGLTLRAILITHHHGDHVGGLKDLLAAHPVPVFGPAGEHIAAVTVPVDDGDTGILPGLELPFRVIGVPGHTRGHIAYVTTAADVEPPWLFCGDTLFASGCGRLFEGTPAEMLDSLDRLAALDPATRVCCAHEYTLSNIAFALACEPDNPDLIAWREQALALRARGLPTVPTTIGHELQLNPFLRTHLPEVRRQLADTLAQPAPDRLAAFALMRDWKNHFKPKTID